MYKKIISAFIPIFSILYLSGCQGTRNNNLNLSIIYGAAAFISLILLIGCCILVHKNKLYFYLLFSSVLIVNLGYTLLAISTGLDMALWAKRIAYLGSVFLPFSMLMIIINVTNTKKSPWLQNALGVLAIVIFFIAASPGILPIYYKEVSFEVIDGTSTLVKVYGPLHPIYLIYLLGYFSAMVAVIIRAQVKRLIDTTSHAVILAIAVFVNIGVWFIEQLTTIDFEFLSISYIISELFLLGVHLVMNEYQRMKSIIKQVESTQAEANSTCPDKMLEIPTDTQTVSSEQIEIFLSGLEILTPTEKAIYEAYVARVTTKEIMANMNIKESTLKFHNRNIYGKLGVSSRKELLEIHKHIKRVKSNLKETK